MKITCTDVFNRRTIFWRFLSFPGNWGDKKLLLLYKTFVCILYIFSVYTNTCKNLYDSIILENFFWIKTFQIVLTASEFVSIFVTFTCHGLLMYLSTFAKHFAQLYYSIGLGTYLIFRYWLYHLPLIFNLLYDIPVPQFSIRWFGHPSMDSIVL